MSEQELEDILDEIKKRANANTPLEPPAPSHSAGNSVPDFNLNLKDDIGAAQSGNTGSNLREEKTDSSMFDLSSVSDFSNGFEKEDEPVRERKPKKKKNKGKKGVLIAVLIIVLAAVAATGVYFGMFYNKDAQEKPTVTKSAAVEEKQSDLNPLTGEPGYNIDAQGKRPVAVVVENEYSTESVRPQWGLSDADIVLEGESEYSTRLLLFWADYTDMPEQIGPTRSARPPFIRFSQLFDSVFIHAGLSHSKGNYEGADTVFKNENVDHINGLQYESDSSEAEFFGRDYNRTSTIEHTAFLNGTNVPELLEKTNISTDLDTNKFTSLNFNSEAKALSSNQAESCTFKWSDGSADGRCPKTGTYTYDESLQKYVTTDFDSDYGTSDVQFENLIFLLDETEYVVKDNYKGSGNSETYCNYALSGGEGKVFSQGTYVDITWGVENGKLWMKTADGKEFNLNPGKSYIGYGSSNHGGSITVNSQNENDTTE